MLSGLLDGLLYDLRSSWSPVEVTLRGRPFIHPLSFHRSYRGAEETRVWGAKGRKYPEDPQAVHQVAVLRYASGEGENLGRGPAHPLAALGQVGGEEGMPADRLPLGGRAGVRPADVPLECPAKDFPRGPLLTVARVED